MHKHSTWFTVDEAAYHLRVVTRAMVYKLIQRRGLPGHKVGREWRFARDEIDAWVKADRPALTAVSPPRRTVERSEHDPTDAVCPHATG